ncbi:MAG TPA: hypothetical protein PK926_00230 [Spirochaetota bacterium]|nr:hypothetical protein [Spirochaetota bacterium]HPI90774.1 hypothetical protein [Spirochaetota bacterium]HPR47504.1 hypothetical protein [Spirochaetota bacterium]
MKVVHVIKKIELIDNDIKDLRKLEKTIARNKSFSTPIVMSIEKQINILLGERIKLLELKIENPPENYVEEIEGPQPVEDLKLRKKAQPVKKAKPKAGPVKDEDDDADLMMLTQDLIDEKINKMKSEESSSPKKTKHESPKKDEILAGETSSDDNSDHVKLLDIALEKGSLKKQDIERDKEKKVRFFRENFPVE